MTSDKAIASNRRSPRWALRIGLLAALVLAILVAMVVAPDQFRTAAPPQPFLPEPVRAALRSASRETVQQDDRSAAPTPGQAPEPLANRSRRSLVPDAIRDALTSDTQVTEFVRSLLPIQDLSAVSAEHRDVARKWNDNVAKSLGELVAVLAESSLTTDSHTLNRRLATVQRDLWTDFKAAKSDLAGDLSERTFLDDYSRSNDFTLCVASQIYADHGRFASAGLTAIVSAEAARARESGDWESRHDEGVYYCQKAGWKGRVALAAVQILLAPSRLGSRSHNIDRAPEVPTPDDGPTFGPSDSSAGAKSHE